MVVCMFLMWFSSNPSVVTVTPLVKALLKIKENPGCPCFKSGATNPMHFSCPDKCLVPHYAVGNPLQFSARHVEVQSPGNQA